MDLSAIPLIDQHAHNLLTEAALSQFVYPAAFTEAHDPVILHHHARHSLTYHRSLTAIGELLACAPTEEAILEQRQALGLVALTRQCFQAANLEQIFLDDGFLPGQIHPIDWHRQFLPVQRLLRLETWAETLLGQSRSFADFLEQFRSGLDPLPAGVVGFKSIAAYRSGLAIENTPLEAAQASYDRLRATQQPESYRLVDKPLIDFLLFQALEIAAKHQFPVQFHTGFGDPDLDLRLANPLHLRPILELPQFRQVPLILLHAAYPYSREAGYLAAVYPQVYVDFGLAIPLLSLAGMRQTLGLLLELAPTSKILYASDAHLIPELYYLGACWGRQVLAETLEQSIRAGEITTAIGEKIALAILRENAHNLYRLV